MSPFFYLEITYLFLNKSVLAIMCVTTTQRVAQNLDTFEDYDLWDSSGDTEYCRDMWCEKDKSGEEQEIIENGRTIFYSEEEIVGRQGNR